MKTKKVSAPNHSHRPSESKITAPIKLEPRQLKQNQREMQTHHSKKENINQQNNLDQQNKENEGIMKIKEALISFADDCSMTQHFPANEKVVLQQENLVLKQEIMKLRNTIRNLNIQSINQQMSLSSFKLLKDECNFHDSQKLSSDGEQIVISCKTLDDEDQDSIILNNELFPVEYDNGQYIKKKETQGNQKNQRDDGNLEDTATLNRMIQSKQQRRHRNRNHSQSVQMNLDSSQQLQEMMDGFNDRPVQDSYEYNPLSQSKSCRDLKMLLNFDLDQVNIYECLEEPDDYIKNISSGEGCISTQSQNKNLIDLKSEQYKSQLCCKKSTVEQETQQMTLKRPLKVMSSSKDTPDFNKSNDTLKQHLYITSPQVDSESFGHKISFKNSYAQSLNPSQKVSHKSLRNSDQRSTNEVCQEYGDGVNCLSKESNHSNLINYQQMRASSKSVSKERIQQDRTAPQRININNNSIIIASVGSKPQSAIFREVRESDPPPVQEHRRSALVSQRSQSQQRATYYNTRRNSSIASCCDSQVSKDDYKWLAINYNKTTIQTSGHKINQIRRPNFNFKCNSSTTKSQTRRDMRKSQSMEPCKGYVSPYSQKALRKTARSKIAQFVSLHPRETSNEYKYSQIMKPMRFRQTKSQPKLFTQMAYYQHNASYQSTAKSKKAKLRHKSQSHEKTKRFDSIMAGSVEADFLNRIKTISQQDQQQQETLVTDNVSQIFLQNMESSFAVDKNIQDIMTIYRQLDDFGENKSVSVFEQIQTPSYLRAQLAEARQDIGKQQTGLRIQGCHSRTRPIVNNSKGRTSINTTGNSSRHNNSSSFTLSGRVTTLNSTKSKVQQVMKLSESLCQPILLRSSRRINSIIDSNKALLSQAFLSPSECNQSHEQVFISTKLPYDSLQRVTLEITDPTPRHTKHTSNTLLNIPDSGQRQLNTIQTKNYSSTQLQRPQSKPRQQISQALNQINTIANYQKHTRKGSAAVGANATMSITQPEQKRVRGLSISNKHCQNCSLLLSRGLSSALCKFQHNLPN